MCESYAAYVRRQYGCLNKLQYPLTVKLGHSHHRSVTTPEGAIVKSVAEYLALIERRGDSFWFRVRNMSFNANRQTFLKPKGALFKNGIPDIVGVYKGRWVGFEVKAKTRQSATQREFQSHVEKAGGAYFVVHGIEECQAALKMLDTPTHNKGEPTQWVE